MAHNVDSQMASHVLESHKLFCLSDPVQILLKDHSIVNDDRDKTHEMRCRESGIKE
jgi:hypothetical protein